MVGGFSSCSGIIFYDTEKQGNNAVFGYYESEKMVIKTGSLTEIKALKAERDKDFDRKDKADYKVMLVLALVVIVLIIAFFVCTSFIKGLIMTAILVASYMPILALCFSNINMYETEDIKMQFRRYHGCEHKGIRIITKEKEITLENLKSMRIYDSECGTVYMGYMLALLMVIAVLTLLSVSFLKALGIVIITIVLLILNLFNPYNPFVFLQKNSVAEPTEREYALVIELLKKFKEL